MSAFGLVKENTMNEYAAPYTPSMPFFTLPTSSEPPYSSYPVTSVQSEASSVYYYDSAYQSYPYCHDFSSASNQEYNQDWYVGSSVPPSHDWYSENEDPAISYYPSVPSYDANGFYAYGSCPYPEQVHLDPFTSSTVITTTPWEDCSPPSTAAGTDLFGSLQTTGCCFYDGCENKDDKQNPKLLEVDSTKAYRGFYSDEIQSGKLTESSQRFKQNSSFWQEYPSTNVGMKHSFAMPSCLNSEGKITDNSKELNIKQPNSSCHETSTTTVEVTNSNNMPTCLDFEGFPSISGRKDFRSTNAQGSTCGKLQESTQVLEPNGWTASFPSDKLIPKTNISQSKLLSSASDPLINWTASFSDDTAVPRSDVPISRATGSTSHSIENSFSTLFSNYMKYENPILLSPQSTTERASTVVQESKGKCRDARGVKLSMDNIGNKLPASEGTSIPKVSFGCSFKPRKVIDSTGTAKQASHALIFDTNSMCSASPSFYNDPNNHMNQLVDMPLMNDMMCNDLSPCQEMDFHTKRMEDFLANCSKGGESGDDAVLTPKSDGLGSFPTRSASFPWSNDLFNPVLDILSSDCHSSKPNLKPLTESASSLLVTQPLTQFSEGSTSHGVIGSSKLLQTSLTKTESLVSASLPSESNAPEGTKPCQLITLVIDGAASVECDQVSAGDASGSHSKNMELRNNLSSSSGEVVYPGNECHKLIHTLHNLSVVLLASSSSLVNMRESDIPILQSVICNLAQCMVKGMCLSTSIDGAALEPEEPVITPDVKRPQQACKLGGCHSKVDDGVDFKSHELRTSVSSSAVGEKEVPVERTKSPQISVEVMQSQMANFETYLELMKLEMRCLKMELEMERLRKNHKDAQFGNGEYKKTLDSEISPDMNLGLEENFLSQMVAPTSQGFVRVLPDLNLNPIRDSAAQIDATMNLTIKGNDLIQTVMPSSQDSVHGLLDLNLNSIRDSAGQTDATIPSQKNEGPEESVQKSRLSTSYQKLCLPNVDPRTGQIEDPSGSKVNSDDAKVQCNNCSLPPELKDTPQLNGQHKMCINSISKSSLSTSNQNILQPNKETRTGRIEDPSGSKVNSGDGNIQCTSKSLFPETMETSLLNDELQVCSIIPASLDAGPYITDGPQLKSNRSSFPETEDISLLNGEQEVCSTIPASPEGWPYFVNGLTLKGNNHTHNLQRIILHQNFLRVKDNLEKVVYFAEQRSSESQNSEGNILFVDNMRQTDNIFLEGGATIESSRGPTSGIRFCDTENANNTDIPKQVSISESDWENINSKEADYIYSSDEESIFNS